MKTLAIHDFCYGLLEIEMQDTRLTHVTPVIIKIGEQGYYKTDWSWRKDAARAALDATNAKLGITQPEALQMEGYAMFGWPDWAHRRREEIAAH